MRVKEQLCFIDQFTFAPAGYTPAGFYKQPVHAFFMNSLFHLKSKYAAALL